MTTDAVYRPSPIKRVRRSKTEMDTIRNAIYEVLEDQHPATVRGTFYQLVSRGIVDKKESEYKGTVGRLMTEMRLSGDLPYHWIADNTRWMRKPNTFSGLEAMLEESVRTYRRALWDSQDAYVEVWLEKEALAGVLVEVTAEWDVPLMVCRGYPSLSFIFEAATAIAAEEKPTHIYYFGDRDPSGVDIPRYVEARIRELAIDVDLTFQMVAVTEAQIVTMSLPTRPTKKTDTRAKGFEGESVEVDAIPAPILRQMVEDCILAHVNIDSYERLMEIEAAERESLRTIAAGMGAA